nr:MAG TPA: hypothetical protein [Caudoviricetes sp.]
MLRSQGFIQPQGPREPSRARSRRVYASLCGASSWRAFRTSGAIWERSM